jgi:ketosteroid isomerase-like protein
MALRYSIPAAAFVLATLVPPDAGAIDASGPGPDIQALQQRIEQWLDGYRHGDVARMMEVFSEDFTDEQQGTAAEMDKAEVERAFKGVFAKYRTEIDAVTDELRVSGDLAFDRGHYTVTLTPKAGGAPIVQQGRFLEVWKRERGTWRVQHIVDMHDPVPAGSDG